MSQEYRNPDDRIRDAIRKADNEFWRVIVDEIGEHISFGDVGPDFVARREQHNTVDVITWLNDNIDRPPAGLRVKFKQDVDRFPHGGASAGELGTVVDLDGMGGVFAVQLDKYKGPGLHEWSNSLVWHDAELLDLHDEIEIVPSPRDNVLRWLVNESVYRVELASPVGQVDRITYVEATDADDAREGVPLGGEVVSIRRAHAGDLAEVIKLDPDWEAI